ncbi:T9SS type A sorting domain-containing protein [bacterium AH-315-B15]|nr:T9SS type A sorting domain-containing protein [bacterium AH-315-B15]MBN4082083.1 T9SS type A sorting domain-containing protein [bacterium AH-315-B15]
MIKRLFISLFILATSLSAQAQYEFFKVYGNGGYDYCRDLVEDVDSAWVLTGSSSSFGDPNAEAFLMKIDSTGEVVWSYNYGGYGTEWGNALTMCNDSSYALAGYTNSFGEGGFDFYLVRADTGGTPMWEKSYGGSDWDRAYDLVQLPDSGFILVGDTYSFGDGFKNAWMVRTDKDGDTLWTKLFDGFGESFFRGIYLDIAADSVIICGGSQDNGAGANMLDGWIVKMDIDGNFGWEMFMGQGYDDYFNDVHGDGVDYALGGARAYSFPTAEEDTWLVKLNAIDHTVSWDTTNTTFSVRSEKVNAVWIRPTTGAEDFFYAASTRTWGYGAIDFMDDFYYGKHNKTGTHITSKNFGAQGVDAAHDIQFTYDNGVIIVGDTKFYSTGGNNIMVLKMTGSWTKPPIEDLIYDGITSGIEEETAINLGLRIYPNPTHDKLTIECDKEIDELTLYSMDGRLIIKEIDTYNTLYLNNLEAGTYILRLRIDGRLLNTQIIKE